ncbi:hypothetical protein IscW_ISCW000370 [Ixodes scapularis]|uniref:Uncharacterized protein n=1 Tax=Ixodes scapularis TaxID=6945 RepID=B7P5A9_IXOSC|nr:hypothetical protein IscW_ISCW000370 [Ixodes scapularis]|eukprot:XP_002407217.1 hypothetical protein IscW_ISCW000370 [Ixodes scapularis]
MFWELKRPFVLRLTRRKFQLTSGVILLHELVKTTKWSRSPNLNFVYFTSQI